MTDSGGCVIRNRAAERRMIWPLWSNHRREKAGSIGHDRRAANHPHRRCIILGELVNHLSIPYTFFFPGQARAWDFSEM